MYFTDEFIDEYSQWMHDESLTEPEVEIPTEEDMEAFEFDMALECLAGMHTLRFDVIAGRFTSTCEDGCNA